MTKKEEKIYQIKNLSEKQVRIMKDALEMYTRLGLLQFDHLIDHMFNFKTNNISKSYLKNRDMIKYHINEIKKLLVEEDLELSKYSESYGWSLGIGSPHTDVSNKIAYEMEKDIELIIEKSRRGKLTLSDETPIVVNEMNTREEKLNKIVKNLKE